MENIVRESGEMDSIIDCDWRCDRCHRQCICESDHVGNGLSYGAYVDGISAAFCRSHDCFSLSCYGAREECRNRYGAYGSTVRSEYDAGKSGTIDFDCDSFDAFVWRFCRPGRCGTSVWGKPRKLART